MALVTNTQPFYTKNWGKKWLVLYFCLASGKLSLISVLRYKHISVPRRNPGQVSVA